jgi:hypothetical protein
VCSFHNSLIIIKIVFIVGFALLIGGRARAQTADNYVTEIVTDYNGYWRSGTGLSLNTILTSTLPDNSHQLLAFTLGGTRYTTGVSDRLLSAKGLAYPAARYWALPVTALSSTITGNTKIGLGQLFDKVDNGPSSPPNDYTRYLTDGVQDLDLGTGVANLPGGTLTIAAKSVVPTAIGDGTPDVFITQIASPDATTGDKYQFLDANGNTIGKQLTIQFANVPVVGKWTADFYEASQSIRGLLSGFIKTPRPLRLWAADFSAFDITASDQALWPTTPTP